MPLTTEEVVWLNDLFKPEEDYYKAYSPPQPPPSKGAFLLLREPLQQSVKLVYPSGDFLSFPITRNLFRELVKVGVPKDKVERAMDYVYNFGRVYVRSVDPEMMAPVLKTVD